MDYDPYEEDPYMFQEEEGQFLPEVNIFERGEIVNENTLEQIARDAGINPEVRKKTERFYDNRWRFYVYVNAAAYRLVDEGFAPGVRKSEVTFILKQIRYFENQAFKNPETFILGYAVAKDGRINKLVLDEIISKLGQLTTKIKPADVLRYARLWLQVLT